MAFSRYFGTLAAGGQFRADIFQARVGGDPQAQYAMASPRGPTTMKSVGQARRVTAAFFIYSTVVTNTGSVASDLDVQGGGLT